MLHFYDECPYELDELEGRLGPARVLSQIGIPCLIHGEDALAFVHWVPTGLFALNIVVANEDVPRAVSAITSVFPYRIFTGIHPHLSNHRSCDPHQTRSYPNSTFLDLVETDTCHPETVLIHPEFEFNLVVSDYSRSVPLPPFPDNIRFPTRAAFLDSTIETRLDPNSGLVTEPVTSIFEVWINYMALYTLRNTPLVLPNGELEPESEELKRSLKPENQLQFEEILRGKETAYSRLHHFKLRREVLRNMGKIDLADRPRPRLPPGNRQYIAEKEAAYEAKWAREKAQSASSSRATTSSTEKKLE
ncbi:hypothetical protein CVT25_005635 [Psilocybe cyanescens]|uniref:Uncharacterized protein n=1 Tax=Psilocybe cyanescens TaxID=93625 RepID=A0A409X6J8_PSICY|nr:hypothetical protein CVT25_005635 [Psilocybe cyanescens]